MLRRIELNRLFLFFSRESIQIIPYVFTAPVLRPFLSCKWPISSESISFSISLEVLLVFEGLFSFLLTSINCTISME